MAKRASDYSLNRQYQATKSRGKGRAVNPEATKILKNITTVGLFSNLNWVVSSMENPSVPEARGKK